MTQALVYDVDIQTFVPEVLQRSQEVPVMVDFWAEWCGPCKTLTPILERLAHAYKGRFVLAKCNTEENPELAEKLRIRNLPNVKLFVGAKLVGEFSGVQPEAEIRRFIEHYTPAPERDPFDVAKELVEQGEVGDAQLLLSRILSAQPDHDKARFLLLRLLLQQKMIPEAEGLVSGFKAGSSEIVQAQQMLALYKEAESYEAIPALETAVQKDPKNLESLYRLGVRLALETRYQDALENFITLLQKDKNFGEGKARKTMLALFELIGLQDPLTDQYRKKMARIIL